MITSLLRRSRTTWLISASLVAVLVFAGAGLASARVPRASSPVPHASMTSIHVDLNWLPNVEFAGIWVALQKGWFAKAHLNLGSGEVKGLTPGVRPYDFSNTPEFENTQCLHHSGQLCIGFDDSSAIPIARQAGDKLVGLWAGSQKTPFGFMTCFVPKKHKSNNKCKSNTGKNIKSPKQWKGLKIGYQQDELYVPEIMLGSVGLSLSDVKPQQVGFSTSDLTTGQTDAHLVFINNEPITLRLEGVKTNVIPAYNYGMGAFYADVMFVNSSQVGKYGKAIKSFVSIVDRGWKYAMHNPKTTASMIVNKYFSEGTAKQQQIEITQFARTLSRDPAGKIDGRMTLSRWKKIVHDLKTFPGSLGGNPIITANIKAGDCFTSKYAPAGAK